MIDPAIDDVADYCLTTATHAIQCFSPWIDLPNDVFSQSADRAVNVGKILFLGVTYATLTALPAPPMREEYDTFVFYESSIDSLPQNHLGITFLTSPAPTQ